MVYVEIKHPINKNGEFDRKHYCEICLLSSNGEIIYSTPINYISSSLIPNETLNYYGRYRGDYQNALGDYHVARDLAHHIKDKFTIGWGKHTEWAIRDLLSNVLDENDKPVYTDYEYIDVAEMILPSIGIKDYVALRHVSKALGVSYDNLSKNIELYLKVLRGIHLSLQDRDYLATLPSFKSSICTLHLEEEANKLGYSLYSDKHTAQEDSVEVDEDELIDDINTTISEEPKNGTLQVTNNQAKKIVDGIIGDLTNRKGLSGEWYSIDEEVQENIRKEWIRIIMASTNQP